MSDQPFRRQIMALGLGFGVMLGLVATGGGDSWAGGNNPDEKIPPVASRQSAPGTALPKRGADGRIPIPTPDAFAKPDPIASPSAPRVTVPPTPRPESAVEIPDPLGAPARPRLAPLPVPRFQARSTKPATAATTTTTSPSPGVGSELPAIPESNPGEPAAGGAVSPAGTSAPATAGAVPPPGSTGQKSATAPVLKGGAAEPARPKPAPDKGQPADGSAQAAPQHSGKAQNSGKERTGTSEPAAARPAPLVREVAQPAAVMPPPHPPVPTPPSDRSYLVQFAAGASTVPDSAPLILDSVALRLHDNANARLEIRAFAEGSSDAARDVRKLALARGEAVREQLETRGIRASRMDIRALGGTPSAGEKDRVELVLIY